MTLIEQFQEWFKDGTLKASPEIQETVLESLRNQFVEGELSGFAKATKTILSQP